VRVVVPRQLAERRRRRRLPAAAGAETPGRPCACAQGCNRACGGRSSGGGRDAGRHASSSLALLTDHWRCTHGGAPFPSSAFFLAFHSLPRILDRCSYFVRVFVDFAFSFYFLVPAFTLLPRVAPSARAQLEKRMPRRQIRDASCLPALFCTPSLCEPACGRSSTGRKPQAAADRSLAVHPVPPDGGVACMHPVPASLTVTVLRFHRPVLAQARHAPRALASHQSPRSRIPRIGGRGRQDAASVNTSSPSHGSGVAVVRRQPRRSRCSGSFRQWPH
jgi:hypothetical protein